MTARRQRLRLAVLLTLVLGAGCTATTDVGRQLIQPFAEIIGGTVTWATSIPGLVLAAIGTSMPVHGNWCGANHPKRGTAPPPLDDLDTACMRHDLCYEQRGMGTCECDQRLVEEVLRGRDIRTGTFSAAEVEVLGWAIHAPCTGCKHTRFSSISYVNVCGNSITIQK